jgi:hypothetical protein
LADGLSPFRTRPRGRAMRGRRKSGSSHSSSGHARRVEWRRGPNRQSPACIGTSFGAASPRPSPDECLNTAIEDTSSMVGKCRAIVTARCLVASGRLSSRASSIRKPPAHRRALVLSSGIVIPDSLLDAGLDVACLRVVAWVKNSPARSPLIRSMCKSVVYCIEKNDSATGSRYLLE